MIYKAKHHLNIGGVRLRPGDVFEADMTEAQLEWLLSKKAIEETGSTLKDVFEATGIDEDGIANGSEDKIDDGGEDGNAVDEAPVVAEMEEAPEIDVMDGICAADEPEEPEVPKKRRGRK